MSVTNDVEVKLGNYAARFSFSHNIVPLKFAQLGHKKVIDEVAKLKDIKISYHFSQSLNFVFYSFSDFPETG